MSGYSSELVAAPPARRRGGGFAPLRLLYVQVLVAIALGLALGWWRPGLAGARRILDGAAEDAEPHPALAAAAAD